MDLNRLTQKSQEALSEAQNKAVTMGNTEVDGEHLLWADEWLGHADNAQA